MKKERNKNPIQPVSGTKVPRYAGPSTFARLPELRDVESCDVAIVGVPFDSGTSYRPGARFGPQSIRQASRHLRTNYHPSYDVEPFKVQQVADAGDIACNPFNIDEAIKQIEVGATDLLSKVGGIISLGGDHTIAVPLLRAVNKKNNGPVSLVHFDAHLDTWDTYFGAPYTHGTPFRRAREELGDLLFSCINLSRKLGIDTETVIRESNRKFEKRFKKMEKKMNKKSLKWELKNLEKEISSINQIITN